MLFDADLRRDADKLVLALRTSTAGASRPDASSDPAKRYIKPPPARSIKVEGDLPQKGKDMATSQMSEVIQHLHRAVLREGAGLTDGQLLENYLNHHDEAALAALVGRHAPMILSGARVCGAGFQPARGPALARRSPKGGPGRLETGPTATGPAKSLRLPERLIARCASIPHSPVSPSCAGGREISRPGSFSCRNVTILR